MKIRIGTLLVGGMALVVGLLLLPASPGRAQIWSSIMAEKGLKAQEVPAEKVPEHGTFWSFSRTNYPPLPFNQFPDLPVYYLGYGNAFLVDDTSVDFVALAEARETDKVLRKAELKYGLREADALDALEETEGGGMLRMAYEYPTNNTLWLEITSVTNGLANLIVHGTVADETYEILSKQTLTNTIWASEGSILGTAVQDWTPTTVPVLDRTNSLFLWARSWVDSDGDGLPDWWELAHSLDPDNPDTGNTGVSDGYKDADGDGWSNLEEYQHGTNPNQFNTPHAPQPIHAKAEAYGSNVLINWGPAGGAVVEYVLWRSLDTPWDYEEIARIPATNRTFVDIGVVTTNDLRYLEYGLYAEYANNEVTETEYFSAATDDPWLQLYLMYGPGRQPYAILTQVPAKLHHIHFEMGEYNYLSGFLTNIFTFDLSPTNFQSGIAALPTNLFGTTGSRSGKAIGYYDTGGRNAERSVSISPEGQAYVDASKYLKANLNFLLRAAVITHSFGIANGWGSFEPHWPSSTNYEFYPIQGNYGSYHPDSDNYLWLNFLWNPTNVGAGYIFDTGAYCDRLSLPAPEAGVALGTPRYAWSAPLINLPPTPPVGMTNNPNWVFFDDLSLSTNRANSVGISIGGNGFVSLAANARNIYGLPITSALFLSGVNGSVTSIGAGGGATIVYPTASFFQTEQPQLQTVDYYFTRVWPATQPGIGDFQTTNLSPLLAMSIGDFAAFTGYAKQAIVNGYSNKFAYLGQYFHKALKITTNGVVTTNSAGILSEYGEFFSTEVGRVALVTKPDIQTGQRGTGVVHVLKIQLDVNHDGVMDLSLTGPDNTSFETPFKFWANNDFDRWHWVDGSDSEQDDLEKVDSSIHFYQTYPEPDYAFLAYPGTPAIPCERDLEDYTRLWIPGLSSVLAAMPTNYTAELIYSGDAPLRIFRAYETDGGTNYLFNPVTASNQVANSTSLYLGLLGSIILNGQTNIGEHFIFCGTQRSRGWLELHILDDNQQEVCMTSTYIQIKDIKEMYERWTVGDVGSKPPLTVATNAVEGLPLGVPAFRYDTPTDTNTAYILHVHGWNMEPWEKDRFGESAFKRLYWQGYQGRFGIFRWPTLNRFPSLSIEGSDPNHFDKSELNAWKSGAPLRNLLAQLNSEYPGQVYLTAHSMGNVVAGEALRLAGTNQLVNTYVAMEAAVPSHAYDATMPTRSLGAYDDYTPNRYAVYYTNGASSYFAGSAGAGSYVNFYNTNDYAFAPGAWPLDQNLKPAGSIGYGYIQDTGKFYKNFYSTELVFPTDTYQIFALCDEARCNPLGTQPNVSGVFKVGPIYHQIDLGLAPYNFSSEHKYHSGQFRSTNMKRWLVWDQVLRQMQLKF